MIQTLFQLLSAFSGEASRVRCFLHILNLVAKSILKPFDTGKSKRKAAAAQQEESDSEEEEAIEDAEDGSDDIDEALELEFGEQEVLSSDEPMRLVLWKVSFVIIPILAYSCLTRHLIQVAQSRVLYQKFHNNHPS